jgi:hypothetical protein
MSLFEFGHLPIQHIFYLYWVFGIEFCIPTKAFLFNDRYDKKLLLALVHGEISQQYRLGSFGLTIIYHIQINGKTSYMAAKKAYSKLFLQ